MKCKYCGKKVNKKKKFCNRFCYHRYSRHTVGFTDRLDKMEKMAYELSIEIHNLRRLYHMYAGLRGKIRSRRNPTIE